MNIILLAIAALAGLGLVVGIGSWLTRKKGEPDEVVPAKGDCTTCTTDSPQCEQACMMEAATKEIEYFDDEELDAFRGRPSDTYTDEEVEQFSEVLYTMQPSEVKAWYRSLSLRGINVPNQLKDELFLIMEDEKP